MLSNSVIAIIILIFIIISFSSQRIPIAVTALLGGLAMMLFGIIEPADVVSGFGSDTVMMVAGVIVIGNEANGLRDEVMACCDARVTIPMAGRAESLNAAAAAAILLWEMTRQPALPVGREVMG